MTNNGTMTASAVRLISLLIETSRIDAEAPLKNVRESHRKLWRHISNGLDDSSKLTTTAISQLFSRKYTRANKSTPGSSAGRFVACWVSGATPVTAKKSCAANQIESAGAVVLKSSLCSPIPLRNSQRE